MPATLKLGPHLTSDELKRRYLAARHPNERTRWHALWLVSTGTSGREAGRAVGRSNGWLTAIARAYNERGPSAVPVVERGGRQWGGSPRSLPVEAEAALLAALEGDPPGGGLWSGAKVAEWIAGRTGRWCHPATGWKYLRRLEQSRQVPRPAHPEAAGPEERLAHQKKSST